MIARAAVFCEQGRPVEVHEIERRAARGEVLVRMAAVGICGTDLHVVKGEWRRPTPMVLGHEGAGVVEAVGRVCRRLRPVTRSCSPGLFLPRVSDCRRAARPRACRFSTDRRRHAARRRDGHAAGWRDALSGTATGRCPSGSSSRSRLRCPSGSVPLKEAALLGCAALTAWAPCSSPQVWSRVLRARGRRGGVGQFVVQGARIAGASQIVCVDPLEERLELVQRLGATEVAQPDGFGAHEGDASRRRRLRVRRGRRPRDDEDSVPVDAERGLTVIVGLPAAGARLELDPREFIRREKRLTGTIYGSRTGRRAARPARSRWSGELDLRSQLGPSFSLDDRTPPSKRRWPAPRAASSSCPDVPVEHVERMRGHGWTPTRRSHPLLERVPVGRAGRDGAAPRARPYRRFGDYPRKHAEADFHRVLRFEDEIDVRITRSGSGARRSRGASRSCETPSLRRGRLVVVHVGDDGRPTR